MAADDNYHDTCPNYLYVLSGQPFVTLCSHRSIIILSRDAVSSESMHRVKHSQNRLKHNKYFGWICKLAPPPLAGTSSELHSLLVTHWGDWLQGNLWHQKHHAISNSGFWDCLWFTAVLKTKYSAMVLIYESASRHINNIKSLIFMTGGL